MPMSSRERNLLIVFGVIAVGALAYFLLFRGGGEPEERAAPTPPSSPPPTAQPTPPLEEPGGARRPPRAFAFFGGRDPFVPLVVAEAGGGGVAPAPAAPGETPSPGETPGVTDGEEDGGPVSMGGQEVVLIDIFEEGGEPVVQVSVDGETFTVGEGENFARNFEVVSIQGNCATFLFGDEQFTLCEGERPK